MTDYIYSEKADLVAAFFEKRLQDNLSAFKKFSPDIYNLFSGYSESRYYLVFDQDGNANLWDAEAEKLLYSEDIYQASLKNYERYKSKSVVKPIFCVPPNRDAPIKPYMPVHETAIRGVGDAQLEMLSEVSTQWAKKAIGSYSRLINGQFSEIEDQGDSDLSLHIPRHIGCLVCLSAGIGLDLELLYKDIDVNQLYVLEPEPDIFYASLQLVDWAGFLAHMKDGGKGVKIIINDDYTQLAEELVRSGMDLGRHIFANAYFYSGFYQEGYEELYSEVKKHVDRDMFTGFGFYDDSRVSVAHTFNNIKSGIPCIQSNRRIDKVHGQSKIPLFIIGNGPSLDDDIDFIKSSADKCFIMSCGTSISALYSNGIKPDVHVELERMADSIGLIEKMGGDVANYLKDILFVGMSQVHPGVFDLFDLCGQMPKDMETGSLFLFNLFKDRGVPLVSGVGPSCVHTGFVTAVLLGFRDIYFFGVDMGYKDRQYHHSKYSIYGKMNDEKKELFTPPASGVIEYEANHGDGLVSSSGLFPIYKAMLEKTVASFVKGLAGDLKVFNCSGGALLEGIEPIDKVGINFPEHGANKLELARAIHKSHFSFLATEAELDLMEVEIKSSFEKVVKACNWLKGSVNEVESISEAEKIVKLLSYGFHKNEELLSNDESWLYSLFDGSLLYLLSSINTIIYFPCDEQLRIDAFNKCVGVLRQFFDDLGRDFKSKALECDKEEYHNHF